MPIDVDMNIRSRPEQNAFEISTRVRVDVAGVCSIYTTELENCHLDGGQLRRLAHADAQRIAEGIEDVLFRRLTEHLGTQARPPIEPHFTGSPADLFAVHAVNWANMNTYYGIDPAREIPAPYQVTEKVSDLPEKMNNFSGRGNITARRLITDGDAVLEGIEMNHCIGNANFRARLSSCNYIAYHISMPDGQKPRSGFTVGFFRAGNSYRFDQVKGKSNSTDYTQSDDLRFFIDYMEQQLRGVLQNNITAENMLREKRQRDEKKRVELNALRGLMYHPGI